MDDNDLQLHGKQPLPSQRSPALPDLLTPGLWARAPSFLLWLFPALFVLLWGWSLTSGKLRSRGLFSLSCFSGNDRDSFSVIIKKHIHLEIVSSDPLVKVCSLKYISTLSQKR